MQLHVEFNKILDSERINYTQGAAGRGEPTLRRSIYDLRGDLIKLDPLMVVLNQGGSEYWLTKAQAGLVLSTLSGGESDKKRLLKELEVFWADHFGLR